MIRPWAILTTCCMAMFPLSFTTAGLAMCMPSMAADLRLDYAQQGLVFSAPMWPLVVSLAVAAIADRIGFRGLLLLASAVQAVGWFVMAEAQTFPQALGAAVLAGIGGSIADPLLTPIICAVYPERRARMANFLHGFFCVGLAGTAVLVMCLQPAGFSWRDTLRIMAALCLPYGLVSVMLTLPRQTHRGEERMKVRSLIGRPVFLLLGLMMIMAAATEMGPANWLPTLVQSLVPADGAGAGSNLSAGIGLALFGSLMGAGRFLAGAIESRIGVRRMLASAAVVCTVCLAAVALPLGTTFRVACLAVVGFGVACFWPTLLAIAGDRFPQAGATMFSVLSAFGTVGCVVAPVAVGWMATVFGSLSPALAALALAPAVILVASLRLRGGGRAPDAA